MRHWRGRLAAAVAQDAAGSAAALPHIALRWSSGGRSARIDKRSWQLAVGPPTQLQAGELVPLNYAGSSSGAAQQVALVWMQAVAPCPRAAFGAVRGLTLGSARRSPQLGVRLA